VLAHLQGLRAARTQTVEKRADAHYLAQRSHALTQPLGRTHVSFLQVTALHFRGTYPGAIQSRNVTASSDE